MRNTDFDVARAISIMLVVFGHSMLSPMHPALSEALSCVRMPLFLVLSGVFFKPHQATLALVSSKADALLKPYLVMAVALGSMSWLVGKVDDPVGYIKSTLSFNGPQLQGGMYPLWFLAFLWALHTIASLFCRVTHFTRRSLSWRLAVVLTLFLCGHAALPSHFEAQRCVSVGLGYVGLPFNADILPLGLAWFLLGHVMGPSLRSQPMSLPWTMVCSLVFVACQVLAAPRFNLYMRDASDAGFTGLACLSGTLAMLGWSRALSRLGGMSKVLAPIGRNSLYILMWHSPVQTITSDQLRHWWPMHQEAACWLALTIVIFACHVMGELVKRHRLLRMWFEPASGGARPAHAGGVQPAAFKTRTQPAGWSAG